MLDTHTHWLTPVQLWSREVVCGVLLKAAVLKVGSPDPQGSVAHCQGVLEEFTTKYVKKTNYLI